MQRYRLREPKQISDRLIVIDRDVQIARGDADVAMPYGVSYFSQRSAASKGVADKCAAAVVDGERFQPGRPQRLAGGAEPACGASDAREAYWRGLGCLIHPEQLVFLAVGQIKNSQMDLGGGRRTEQRGQSRQ